MPGEIGDSIEGGITKDGVADAAIGIAAWVERESFLYKVIIILLVGGVGAKGIVTNRDHEIGAIDADLDGA